MFNDHTGTYIHADKFECSMYMLLIRIVHTFCRTNQSETAGFLDPNTFRTTLERNRRYSLQFTVNVIDL